ncbi:hypothetical protein Trydic_g12694 [Trypoxylus dichotomus]
MTHRKKWDYLIRQSQSSRDVFHYENSWKITAGCDDLETRMEKGDNGKTTSVRAAERPKRMDIEDDGGKRAHLRH